MRTPSFANRVAVQALAMLLAGCTSYAPSDRRAAEPQYVAAAPFDSSHEPVALVLSGGAARGFAHLGVLRVLESSGLRPDIVVGSSAGSIVGSLYASGMPLDEVERAVANLDLSTFSDWSLPWLGLGRGPMGLVKGERLRRFLDEHLPERNIERFPIRFAAVATDLQTGDVHVFNAGDAGVAVLASSAVPGIVAPVEIGGRLYADGQISSPLPVQAARRLGARRIIAVDVLYPPRDAAPRTALGVLFQSFIVSAYRLKSLELPGADLVIAPELPQTAGQLGFSDRVRLIAAGERAGRESLDRIDAIFAGSRAHRMDMMPPTRGSPGH